MDRPNGAEDNWFRNVDAEANDEATKNSPEKLIKLESKTLLEHLRNWSGYRYVAAFMLMARMSCASEQESIETVVDTGEKMSESIQKETSEVLSGSEREMVWEASQDASKFLERAKATEGFRISDRALMAIAESNPTVFFAYLEGIAEFSDPATVREAAEIAMLADPSVALENDALATVRASDSGKHPELAAVYAIADSSYGVAEKQMIYALFDEVSNGTLTVDQAAAIAKDERALAGALIRINARDGRLGRNQVDWALLVFGSKTLGPVNELHEKSDAVRFKSLEGMGASELYTAITHFPRAYLSTYNGAFDRMLKEMSRSGMSGDQLLKEVGPAQFRVFVRDTIKYDRIGDFLATMAAPEQEKTMRTFVEGLDGQKDMVGEAAMVADAIRNTKDSAVREAMKKSLELEYLRVKTAGNVEATTVLGILSMVADPKPSWIPKEQWEGYRISETNGMSSNELQNKNGEIVERHFFSNDTDGESSFAHFLSQYKGKPGWKIESHETHVVIKSTGKDNKIIIYANRPAFEVSLDPGSTDVVGAALAADGLVATVAVHRGHIYHGDETIAFLGANTKLFIHGGCGGFDQVEQALNVSRDMQVISTKGTGTMRVNDAVINEIHKEMLSGKSFEWSNVSEKIGSTVLRGDEDYTKYVFPNENIAAQVYVGYYKYMNAYETQPDSGLLASAEERPDGA